MSSRGLVVIASWLVAILGTSGAFAAETAKLFLVADPLRTESTYIQGKVHCLEFHDGKLVEMRLPPEADDRFPSYAQIRLVEGRYALATYGTIFDMVREEFLLPKSRDLVSLGEEGAVAYFCSDMRAVKNKGRLRIYAVDFAVRPKLRQITDRDRYWRWFSQAEGIEADEDRLFSPDGTRYVATQPGSWSVWLGEPSGRRLLAENLVTTYHEMVSQFPQPPVLWLNNDEILTQNGNGNLIVIRLDGSRREVVRVPKNPSPSGVGLARDRDGRIVYGLDDAYLIDVAAGSASPYEWRPLGDGFSIEVLRHGSRGAERLRCRDRDIAAMEGLSSWAVATMPGGIAIGFKKPGTTSGQTGVRIWFESTDAWQEVEFRSLECMIGWLPEDTQR